MEQTPAETYEISIDNLTYSHTPGSAPSLSNVNIHLPKGSRTILVGANGGTSRICSQTLENQGTFLQRGSPRYSRSWRANVSSQPRVRMSESKEETCFATHHLVSPSLGQNGECALPVLLCFCRWTCSAALSPESA